LGTIQGALFKKMTQQAKAHCGKPVTLHLGIKGYHTGKHFLDSHLKLALLTSGMTETGALLLSKSIAGQLCFGMKGALL